ncbi:glycosyltransferase, partial [Leucobacter sp. M11]|uniref:glycosyltransferase n=1 Tax=Leucobacter sp. M11 TaxID=2993565 RepID=UPI002D7E8AFE
RVLHRAGKLGLGTAYLTGFRIAIDEGYRTVVEMDADGSHLPEQLPALLAEVDAGADFALGSRWVAGGSIVNWPWYRQLVSRTGTLVARISLRSKLHDITSGYRAIRTAALAGLDLDRIDAHGYGFQVELAWSLERAGFRIAEVPISFVERAEGRSKMTFGIAAEALRIVLRQGFLLRFRPAALPPVGRATPEQG